MATPFLNVNPNVTSQAKFNLFDFTPKASLNVPQSIKTAQTIQTTPQASFNVPKSIQVAKTITPQASTTWVARIWTQAQAEWLSDDEISQLIDEWYSDDEIMNLDNELKTKPIQQPQAWINTWIWWVVEWTISQVPKFVSNVAWFVPKTLSQWAWYIWEQFWVAKENNPFYTSWMGDAERLKALWEASKQAIKKFGIEVDDTTAQKIWEEITNITWSTLITPQATWAWIVWKIAPKLWKYWKYIAEWASWMAKYDIWSEWEVKPSDVAIWAWLWLAFPLAWAWLKWTKNILTKTIPTNLQLKWLLNPAKLEQVTNTLIQEWQKSPENVAKWMLDRWIKWDKEKIIWMLEKRATESKKAVDDILATIDKKTLNTYENKDITKALTQVRNDLDWVAWMEWKLSEIDWLLAKNTYNLSEANKAKRILDEQYNLYTKAWWETAWMKAEWLRTIRQNIRKFIEDTAEQNWAKNIKLLNNETQVSKALSNAIAKKENADYVRELLSPFAWSAVWWVIWWASNVWPFKWDDILSRVWNIMVWALIWKWLTSTTIKTNVASLLNKLTTKEIWALEQYIKSWWKTTLWKELEDKVASKIKWLLPAWWESSYKKPSIILPLSNKQLVEESKIPLKNTKYGTTETNLTNKSNNIISNNANISNNKVSNTTSLINSSKSNNLSKQTQKLLIKEWKLVSKDLQTNLSKLTKSNIDEIASKITTDSTKLAKVKQVIKQHLIKYWEQFKDYMSELVDKIAEVTWTKLNLLGKEWIWVEKTKLLKKSVDKVSDDLISEAKKYKSAEEFIDNNIADIYWDKFFHWSTINIPEIKVLNQWWELWQWFYITNNATLAKDFVEKQLWKQKAVVNKIWMKWVKMKFMTKRDYVSEVRKYNNSEDFRKDIINEWYDWIWSPDTNQWVIFPEKVKKLKTEAQLKQIYEQANKPKLLK